ncbi:MAG TPA: hypothetical protein VEP49_13145, partial [Acidimicrobiia bacterium]|nr:hypothetical protein [Acidimicrobiia bacterium]
MASLPARRSGSCRLVVVPIVVVVPVRRGVVGHCDDGGGRLLTTGLLGGRLLGGRLLDGRLLDGRLLSGGLLSDRLLDGGLLDGRFLDGGLLGDVGPS